MAADGTWAAPVQALQPGSYRVYVAFIVKDDTGKAVPLVLSEQVSVPGTPETVPLPPATTTTQVDGYTLTLSRQPMAGMSHALTVTVA